MARVKVLPFRPFDHRRFDIELDIEIRLKEIASRLAEIDPEDDDVRGEWFALVVERDVLSAVKPRTTGTLIRIPITQ